ncbi:MAG: GAF domain-containing protein [Deltaproteobacteria bacterium]|nr:GAF domain-containing protein [Deltaproteobacteria bacterium]NCP03155.1 GAF domain-containing protein [Deltaproteobacteria bacterium]
MTFQDSQQQKLLQAQIDIGRKLTSGFEREEILPLILQLSRDIFGFENAIIRLLDAQTRELLTIASFGYPEDAETVRIKLGEGVMGHVALTGQPLLVKDVEREPSYIGGIRGARSELAVPLISKGRVIGVFNVESCQPQAFSVDDIAPLLTLAGLAAVAIETANLYDKLQTASDKNRELDQLNRQILRSSSLGIYTLDAQLRITSWNLKMESYSGLSREQVLGAELLSLFPHLRNEGFDLALRQVLDGGGPGKLKFAHRNLRGELRFQKRRLAPLKDGERTTGVLVMVEDITEFRRLLDQTIQTEKLAEVGRLTAGIAHEINNPLAVISYAVQLLEREEQSPAEERDLIGRIQGEVERLKTLTGGLLSFSRNSETRRQPTDLQQVLKEVLLLARYELTHKNIELMEKFAPLPRIMGDRNKLKQVFLNLIINAVQAMGDAGQLKITTHCNAAGEACIEICDNGPGIAPEIRERIFEPFFTTKPEGEGTGLGLYLSRSIMAEHDALMRVDSTLGAGTTFTLLFPAVGLPAE